MSLETRIEKLERQNRRYRWAHMVLLAGLVGSCAKQAVPPDRIVAKEFHVVDDEGTVYASLGVVPWNPEGALILHDRANGDRRTSLLPADVVLENGGQSIHLEAGAVSLFEMRDDSGWTGAKLSAHRQQKKSSLWLTDGAKSIFSGP